jgi:hypothetical protein
LPAALVGSVVFLNGFCTICLDEYTDRKGQENSVDKRLWFWFKVNIRGLFRVRIFTGTLVQVNTVYREKIRAYFLWTRITTGGAAAPRSGKKKNVLIQSYIHWPKRFREFSYW